MAKEKILSKIKLKYLQAEARPPRLRGAVCALCSADNILIGGIIHTAPGEEEHVCESCATERFRRVHGYLSIEAAAARRRRAFDIEFLFQEKILDSYLKETGKTIKELDRKAFRELLELARFLFHQNIPPNKRKRMEEASSQDSIERAMEKLLFSMRSKLPTAPIPSPFTMM
ncbi:MAG: hypothetical protein HYS59_02560 [Candidatus Vogelbacteria bacterium]|nr:hypothetical protein [Candidatus Vogelbacteria bacterium]